MFVGMETDMLCSMCFAAETKTHAQQSLATLGLTWNTCGGAVDCCALFWLVCFRLVGSDADAVAWGGVTSPARMCETKCNVQMWERLAAQRRQELTLEASLSREFREELINNGVSLAALEQPWVSAREQDGRWGIGCEVCSRALNSGQLHLHSTRAEFATFSCQSIRKDILKKHQASLQHQKSVLLALGVNSGPNGAPLLGAPPLELFKQVLAQVQRGESLRSIDAGGTGDRMKNIKFCLLESMMEAEREFMKRAATLVLLRDERHGRLLLRYAACTRDLETRRGTLAVMRDYDSPNAENLVKATKRGFKQFCTCRLGKPRTMSGLPAPELDRELLHRMRMITEMFVNDSASSELLAADISRGRRGNTDGEEEAFTPNVKIVGRDLAHCARHVLKKPWQADEYLSNLFEGTIWHKNSVVQIIDKSDVFRQWFRDYATQVSGRSGKPCASNLSSAKHRFESCSKPLGRFILNLVAVFKTCHRIAITRDSSHEGGLVRNWLATVSSEELLQLALLADAADEGLLLVRQMDREQFDLATLHSSVGDFVERVRMLFKEGGCLTMEHSFTQHCTNLLASGQLQMLPHSSAGQHRVLGPASEDEVRRCVARMSTWADMAKAVVEAEFPDFLAVNAFAVFALADEERAVAQTGVNPTHCQRLAQLFSVDPQELASQLARHRPSAQAIKNSCKCSNHEAWQKTVQRIRQTRGGVDLEALQSVLMRYLVWSSSTAGVEQRFSAGDRLAIEKSPASQIQESLTLRAVFDNYGKKEADNAARRAQEIFSEGCPRARRGSGFKRLDRGTKRLPTSQATSEAGWLRRRRSTVAAGAKAQRHCSAKEPSCAAELRGHLGPGQRKCLAKQQEKKRRREEEAFQDGCLLDEEVSNELRARVTERQKKDNANDKTRIAAARKKVRRVAMMDRQVPWSKFGGLKVWLDVGKIREGDVAALRHHLRQRGLIILDEDDWAQAELFVVPVIDKDKLRERVLWRVALSGCWLLSVGAALGEQGVFVKYQAALRKASLACTGGGGGAE